ncbi:hypothetical protein IQ07DRAFT_82907 [Pyrenochaeta sp. DS3sAY3a]|nr:hypothetical protein IQ07DRAFT_82907 [Pyrenochaeta sp. DS3sAY3a]
MTPEVATTAKTRPCLTTIGTNVPISSKVSDILRIIPVRDSLTPQPNPDLSAICTGCAHAFQSGSCNLFHSTVHAGSHLLRPLADYPKLSDSRKTRSRHQSANLLGSKSPVASSRIQIAPWAEIYS